MKNEYINEFGNKIIFKKVEFKERVRKIKDEMIKKQIDILLIASPSQINSIRLDMMDGRFIHLKWS